MTSIKRSYLSLIFILGIASCATLPKTEIASTANPADELAKLQSKIDNGIANSYEILANQEFSKAIKYRNEASENLKNGKPAEKILDPIGYGDALVEQAKIKAEARRGYVEGILKAREAALSAGVRGTALEKDLKKVDDNTRSYADDFKNDLSTKEYSKIQNDYYQIELSAIQVRELGTTEQLITEAKKNRAESNAPKTFKKTQIDVDGAKNAIAADRHNSGAYARSVNRAHMSAEELAEVSNIINTSNRKTDEDAAIKIVAQNKTIRELEGNLSAAEQERRMLEHNISQKTAAINEQSSELSGLKSKEQMQAAITAVQSDFNSDEAEVFQQGDNVIIRLKKINFPSGSAKIPEDSKALLSKVTTVVGRLDPTEIKVEGHTDAVGNPKKNLLLSKNRAEAVAEYLEKDKSTSASTVIESVGRGYEKPIASNKTSSGRAQNRRVDLIITPKTSNQ